MRKGKAFLKKAFPFYYGKTERPVKGAPDIDEKGFDKHENEVGGVGLGRGGRTFLERFPLPSFTSIIPQSHVPIRRGDR